MLQGRSSQVERALFWRTQSQKAVRKGDWKLLVDGGTLLLFNLRSDVGEHTDRTAEHTGLVRELRQLVEAWEQDVDTERKATATR